MAAQANNISTSPDAVNWTFQQTLAAGALDGLLYDDGTFYAGSRQRFHLRSNIRVSYLYGNGKVEPTAAPTGGSYDADTGVLTVPAGWSVSLPAYNPSLAKLYESFALLENSVLSSWTVPRERSYPALGGSGSSGGGGGETPQAANAFRQELAVSTPTGSAAPAITGGDYNRVTPIPTRCPVLRRAHNTCQTALLRAKPTATTGLFW